VAGRPGPSSSRCPGRPGCVVSAHLPA
jgi:hypothetical protein